MSQATLTKVETEVTRLETDLEMSFRGVPPRTPRTRAGPPFPARRRYKKATTKTAACAKRGARVGRPGIWGTGPRILARAIVREYARIASAARRLSQYIEENQDNFDPFSAGYAQPNPFHSNAGKPLCCIIA